VESIVSCTWIQLIDVQFKTINWFVAVLQIVMVQFLVVVIFRRIAFQGVGSFINRPHCIKEFEHIAVFLPFPYI